MIRCSFRGLPKLGTGMLACSLNLVAGVNPLERIQRLSFKAGNWPSSISLRIETAGARLSFPVARRVWADLIVDFDIFTFRT